jgi:DNA-binding beta-propeller fold protein YncE
MLTDPRPWTTCARGVSGGVTESTHGDLALESRRTRSAATAARSAPVRGKFRLTRLTSIFHTLSYRLCQVLVVALAALAFVLAAPARSGATPLPGSLSQLQSPLNCIGEEGFHEELIGCGTLLAEGTLNAAYQAQVSPDGRNVYSVAVSGDLVEYARNQANGTLTEIGCVTSGTAACAPANSTTDAAAMSSPSAISISPGGEDVYVLGQGTNSLVEFIRDPETGLLTERGCLSEEGTECASRSAKGLNNPYGIAVTPDGRNVYVASFDDEAIAEFSRNTSTGELTQLAGTNNCITSGNPGLTGCETEGVGLEDAIGVAVSPDGKDVYVAAGGTEGNGAIASFERDPSTGALAQLPGEDACISTVNASCAPGVAIAGPEDLVVSPDGRDVYANSSKKNAVLEFRREPSGALAQLGSPNACLMTATSEVPLEAGCTEAKGVEEALGVAISPGGEDVYASSPFEDDEAAFERNAETGVLTQLPAPYECAGKSETEGVIDNECGTQGIHGIAGARRVTVSPDGMNLYVAGQNDHALVELARAVTPSVSSVSPASGPAAGGTTVTIAGSGFVEGAVVDFGATPSASVTVNSASSITAISPAGSGTVDVTVSTYAGTASAADQFTYSPPPISSLPGVSVPLIVPPPVLAVSGNVAPISGKVLVRVPGSKSFVALSSLREIPFGTVIEATHGHVSVTTAEPDGKTQTGEFFEGEFVLKQGRNGMVVAELTGGNFSVCPTARERAHKATAASTHTTVSGKHVVRKLWANAHGSFSTKGNYAAGAVQGTEWLTEDLCDGTLIRVTRDKVRVTNLVTHHHVEVKTGHKYLAKAP